MERGLGAIYEQGMSYGQRVFLLIVAPYDLYPICLICITVV